MRFTVTEEHIKRGLPGSCDLCPIALAIKERLPDHDVLVGESEISISYRGRSWRDFTVSKRTVSFIRRFDNGDESLKGLQFFLSIESKSK